MGQNASKNIRVGMFVMIGTGLLIFSLYLIGTKQNLFGSTFTLKAQFHQVNGLMPGNNVRFTGIDVGTVKSVEIINDTIVNVEMVIENKVQIFIKKNATATVGTDGLMGNKLININASNQNAPSVEDGDVLRTKNPLGTDDMMRTLSITNENVKDITMNLKHIVQKLNSPNTLWNILMDTVVADNAKNAVFQIKLTGERTAEATGDLKQIIKEVKQGKGTIGQLIKDTSMVRQLNKSMLNIKQISDSLTLVVNDMHFISGKIKTGEGAIGKILIDTAFANNMNQGMIHIKNGSKHLEENLEALKHSILLRKYFKKQAKERSGK
jgi:phospholipid/cholesterol/gamma-HCH transport system substrate-binding protein